MTEKTAVIPRSLKPTSVRPVEPKMCLDMAAVRLSLCKAIKIAR